ncbi:MAG: hypothetical protein PHS09_07695 [Candidatus Omnitrophica bacterium]|nr:hypothetical protein [Candidatus Omnitrophota bacterium]MDD5513278.1 hypothetical protein [Candidatus Omnitrophota bacterium]
MRSDKGNARVFLVLGFLALILVILFQNQIKKFVSFQENKLKTYHDNFFAGNDPEIAKRRVPLSAAKEESDLEVVFGEPFASFSRQDWDEFWNVIYGLYQIEEPLEQGLPNRMRQLTYAEIAAELARRYPQPFSYFGQQQWEAFFSIAVRQ